MSTALVTGGTGFVGSHLVAELLKQGYTVRVTLRDTNRRPELIKMLDRAGVSDASLLSVYPADLDTDAGWDRAIDGCEFVHHVASPFPSQQQEEQQIIRPAVKGTLRVLRVSQNKGVRRVIMTSSFAAVGYGHPPHEGREFTEEDWTNVHAPLPPYIKSKALAEQAAWKFMREEGQGMEFTALNPTGIFGTLLGPDYSASIKIIKQMLDGKMPKAPRIYFGVVDVRDVVDLHLCAMTHPNAAGQRFIAVSGPPMSLLQVAQAIRAKLGTSAEKVPDREAPDWLLRLMAPFNQRVKGLVPELGKIRVASNHKAKTLLGWSPRSGETAVVATAESLLSFNPTQRPELASIR